MKHYIDGLVGQQKIYSTAILFLFVNYMIKVLKQSWHTENAVFSTIPIIGVKPPSDSEAVLVMLIFSWGISLWVSVSLLWWLYSFNKHHPEESLGIDYLPGMLFMPFWIRLIASIIIGSMFVGQFSDIQEAPTGRKVIIGMQAIVIIAPLVITVWIKEKFKRANS